MFATFGTICVRRHNAQSADLTISEPASIDEKFFCSVAHMEIMFFCVLWTDMIKLSFRIYVNTKEKRDVTALAYITIW